MKPQQQPHNSRSSVSFSRNNIKLRTKIFKEENYDSRRDGTTTTSSINLTKSTHSHGNNLNNSQRPMFNRGEPLQSPGRGGGRGEISKELENLLSPRSQSTNSDNTTTTTKLVVYICGLSGAGKTLLLQKINKDIICMRYNGPAIRQTTGTRELCLLPGNVDRMDYVMHNYEVILREVGFNPLTRLSSIREHTDHTICGLIFVVPSDIPHIAGNIQHNNVSSSLKCDDNKEDESTLTTPRHHHQQQQQQHNTSEEEERKICEKNTRLLNVKNYFFHLLSEPNLKQIPILILNNITNPHKDENVHGNTGHDDLISMDEIMDYLNVSNLTRKARVMPCTILENQNIDRSLAWILRESVSYYENK